MVDLRQYWVVILGSTNDDVLSERVFFTCPASLVPGLVEGGVDGDVHMFIPRASIYYDMWNDVEGALDGAFDMFPGTVQATLVRRDEPEVIEELGTCELTEGVWIHPALDAAVWHPRAAMIFRLGEPVAA